MQAQAHAHALVYSEESRILRDGLPRQTHAECMPFHKSLSASDFERENLACGQPKVNDLADEAREVADLQGWQHLAVRLLKFDGSRYLARWAE